MHSLQNEKLEAQSWGQTKYNILMEKVTKLLFCLLPLENKNMRAFAGGFHIITQSLALNTPC